MKKAFIFLLSFTLIFLFSLYHIKTNNNVKAFHPVMPLTSDCVFLPLDSRPPCTDFVVQLGTLSGLKVVLPPAKLLGHYQTPGKTEALQAWLQSEFMHRDHAVVAIDMLAYGGLIQSRLAPLTAAKRHACFTYLQNLREMHKDKPLYGFSIIPRLLVSDHLIPDRWYQWHLTRWSILKDRQAHNLPYDQTELAAYQAEIPPEILQKYLKLYEGNAVFNKDLITLADKEGFTGLTIGQDDAQEFGLSNNNRLSAQEEMSRLNTPKSFYVTQGADEIGQMSIAQIYCRRYHYQPRIYIEYGTPAMANYILHFVPMSLQNIVKDKLRMINGQLTTDFNSADFVLFIHCGKEKESDYSAIADRVKELCLTKPLALVDLSYNFEAEEALLPHLVKNSTPLTALSAYAGWNTASNSIGSTLSQAVIFTGEQKRLPREQLSALYAENCKFTCARFLDDYFYQKLTRYQLRHLKIFEGVSDENLGEASVWAERYINAKLKLYSELLLLTNLKRFPFYQDGAHQYYINDLTLSATLPWKRSFEIRLLVEPEYIVK